MKALSIIGIVLFSFCFILVYAADMELESVLEGIDTLGGLASLFLDTENDTSDFIETIESLEGLCYLSSIFGLILSIVGCTYATKKSKAVSA